MIFLLHFTQKWNFIKMSLHDMNKALYQTKNFVIAANCVLSFNPNWFTFQCSNSSIFQDGIHLLANNVLMGT